MIYLHQLWRDSWKKIRNTGSISDLRHFERPSTSRLKGNFEAVSNIHDYTVQLAQKLNKIFYSDEAHFHLGGFVNHRNYGIWGSDNQRLLLSNKCIQTVSLIGRDFRPEISAAGQALTVIGVRFCSMKCSFLYLNCKKWILTTYSFNGTVPNVMQAKR